MVTKAVPRNKQQRRNAKVLHRLIALSDENREDAEIIATALEDALEELSFSDFFGTEGQTDPRGDGRNGKWSMLRVEGVDK